MEKNGYSCLFSNTKTKLEPTSIILRTVFGFLFFVFHLAHGKCVISLKPSDILKIHDFQ